MAHMMLYIPYKLTFYLLTLLAYMAWTSAFIVHILHNRQCLETENEFIVYTYPYQTADDTDTYIL